MITTISKRLSPNDLGVTGTHQAGILIPKDPEILGFFPYLDPVVANPRSVLSMTDLRTGKSWEFNLIYYNNKYRGGTRNEFRLTSMTKFMRESHAARGDELLFHKGGDSMYYIEVQKDASASADSGNNTVQIVESGWRVIKKRRVPNGY